MSTIKSSTTTTTAYSVTADTTGALVIQTGATPTTAVTIDTSQNTTFAKDAVVNGLTVGRGAGAVASNTVVGSGAMSATATGTSNSAFGLNALNAVTSGSNNSGFGGSVLGLNTTGSNNTAMGYQALISNTTASNNTAVGYQAGYTGTTAYRNSLYGYQAGFSLTTGFGNTFIGTSGTYQSAGYFVTTGNNNTVIGGYNGNNGGLDIRTASNYIVLSDGDGNVRGTFDSNGNLLLNTTTVRNSARFTIDYNGASAQGLVLNNTDTGAASQLAMQFYRGATPSVVGQITTTNSATAYVTSSDYRLKENITPITGALAKVQALKPVTYKWKIDGSDSDGFIAHELAEVCPQAVYGEKDAVNADGDIVPQGIDTSFLVATLTAAIQEQQALITQLQADVAALKGA